MESYLDVGDKLQILAEGSLGTKLAAVCYCIEPTSEDILPTIQGTVGPFLVAMRFRTSSPNSMLDDMWRSRTGASEHIWCP